MLNIHRWGECITVVSPGKAVLLQTVKMLLAARCDKAREGGIGSHVRDKSEAKTGKIQTQVGVETVGAFQEYQLMTPKKLMSFLSPVEISPSLLSVGDAW